MRLLIWDLPTRLFHWLLVLCVVGAFVTVKIGGNALQYHFWFGYAVLTLLLFRLIWGLVGGHYSRFLHFPLRPTQLRAYLSGHTSLHLGHNPLGSLSVLALLAALLFQSVSGLFANDDIASEGPLTIWISKSLSDTITHLHHENEAILLGLISLHLAAILFYAWFKRENLVGPMLHGHKTVATPLSATPLKTSVDGRGQRIIALILLLTCAGIVYWITQLKP
ncbi:cytochrome b/b6 domain-containing protein [Parvibium lacunae]|uniref:Cytochrome B n=1 Tax=Parvibium lacunae TaxID=1888893 RepID=A0A368L1K0_9BURK|nr:cytochrome b/b6 domain-containing protein [Parvibium lacunae]RCS57446.1 cytochrome B [Parvibium lacunae]